MARSFHMVGRTSRRSLFRLRHWSNPLRRPELVVHCHSWRWASHWVITQGICAAWSGGHPSSWKCPHPHTSRKWLPRNSHRRVYTSIAKHDSDSSQRPWRLLWHPRYPCHHEMAYESLRRWRSIHAYFGDPGNTVTSLFLAQKCPQHSRHEVEL